jgi:hypothetical protein
MICAGLFRCVSVGAIGGGEMGQKKRRCNVYKFATPAQVMRFANVFVRQRTSDFKKNVDICLAARKTRLNDVDHAYMPGLMTCLSFLDLLSGLYAGKVRGHNDVHFLDFTRRFFPKGRYEEDHLRLLYIEFRHKLAHLAHPYFVLDAPPNPSTGARRLMAWTICARSRKKPIEIKSHPRKQLCQQPTPWETYYDYRFYVSVESFARDARKSTRGPNGYLSALAASPDLQAKFRRCMSAFYPT